jgi:hypothetical protein
MLNSSSKAMKKLLDGTIAVTTEQREGIPVLADLIGGNNRS